MVAVAHPFPSLGVTPDLKLSAFVQPALPPSVSFPDSRGPRRVSQEVLSLHLYGLGAGQVQSCVCSPLSLVTSGPGVSPRVWPLSTWLLSLSPQLPCPF